MRSWVLELPHLGSIAQSTGKATPGWAIASTSGFHVAILVKSHETLPCPSFLVFCPVLSSLAYTAVFKWMRYSNRSFETIPEDLAP